MGAAQVLYNKIGPGVPAEMIDIKENSSAGLIEGNRLDGRGECVALAQPLAPCSDTDD